MRSGINDEATRAAKANLTYDEAHRIFDYDPATGFLRWKVRTSIRVVVGQVAGTPGNDGRRIIHYRGQGFLATRIVWLMNTGAWPTEQVDHKNTNPTDDRMENLRLATHAQNCWNSRVRSDSAIGIKGVMACKDKFQARIQVNKVKVHLGTFDTPEEAGQAYRLAAKKLHGEFAHKETAQ